MKATITSTTFVKEWEGKYGTNFSHKIGYDGKTAFYNSKAKDQTFFKKGAEAEFTEESQTSKDGKKYLMIKPFRANAGGQSNFGKALKREQSKYSGFSTSYAKDLVIAGKITLEELPEYSTVLFNLMVELDKSIES